jgi:HAD superfamily hydrolase (TIGR01458 family)
LPPAFLLDLDGTLYTEQGPIPGAVEVVMSLRRRGVPLRFVTNTTRRSRDAVLARLEDYGFTVNRDELFTPAAAAVSLLTSLDVTLAAPFVSEETLADLAPIDLAGGTSGRPVGGTVGGVVVGDLGDTWSPALLNEAFRYLMAGARLIALQKGRFWAGPTGLELDAGAFVAALEYATGTSALVCGKPEVAFYDAVISSLPGADWRGAADRLPAMIGDDIWGDVQGAQRAGLRGWLVRTGKFRQSELVQSGIAPDRILDSVAALRDEV